MRSFKNLFLPCLAFGLFICQGLFGSDLPTSPIIFDSDTLEYRQQTQVVLASGNVTVQQTSYTFRSDYAKIDIPTKKLEAWGNVVFKDVNRNEIRSRFLNYNQLDGSAQLLDAEGSFGPWLFSTKKIVRDSEGNLTLERAKLSSCEKDFSKYHLYGWRIRILPQKRLTVQHALFKLGPIPVLYLPYYYYPLGEKHLAFQIYPGKSEGDAGFLRTVWGYPVTDETYIKLYLDYLSQRGTGTGGEFNYYSEQFKGSLYGYRIKDEKTNHNRWNARLLHWQSLSPSWVMQANSNQISDDQFPNDFFREDFNRVVREFNSSLAFTYQKRSIYLRVLTERKESFRALEDKFVVDEYSLPQIDFTQTQTPLRFLGIDKTISLHLNNRFSGPSAQGGTLSREIRQESLAQINLFRNIRLIPTVQIIPKIFIRNNWISQPQLNEFKEKNVQRVGTETTLRQNLFAYGDIDWTYRLTQRLQENQDHSQGREEHELNFFTYLRPKDWISLRLDSGYNLPKNKGEKASISSLERYKPIRTELNMDPVRNLQLFFREEYILSDLTTGSSHPLTTQSEILWGARALGQDFISLQTSYNSTQEHQFEIRPTLRFSPIKKWKLEGALRSDLFYRRGAFFNIYRAEINEKEIQTKFEWRCWNFAFLFRERKGVTEFLFNLELEFEREQRENQQKSNRESEWYPWRGVK